MKRIKLRRVQGSGTNDIHTTRYSKLTLIPISLFEQFLNFLNWFFVVKILLYYSKYSIFDYRPEVATLILSLTYATLKLSYEDYRRRRQDEQINSREVSRFNFRTKSFSNTSWRSLRDGDVVKLTNERIPADIVILGSGGPCLVDSSDLNGESGLKSHFPPSLLQQHFETEEDIVDSLVKLELDFEFPPSSSNLRKFDGFFRVETKKGLWTRQVFEKRNCLLRGSTVQTNWLLGIVLFTGSNTRVVRNLVGNRIKVPLLQKKMNRAIIAFILFLLFLIVIGSFIGLMNESQAYFSQHELGGFSRFLEMNAIFAISLSQSIPISLLIGIEIFRQVLACRIPLDKEMHEEGKIATCSNSAIVSDLGDCSFLFSDKTGTLTENRMRFCCLVSNSEIYGASSVDELNRISENMLLQKAKSTVAGLKIDTDSKNELNFLRCLLCIVLCSSVETQNGELFAQSSDELALARFVQQLLRFDKYFDGVRIQLPSGDELEFSILQEIEFSSERKRMSVLCRAKDEIFVFTKGADTSVFPLLNETNQDLVNRFSDQGLRVLILAFRKLTSSEYRRFQKLRCGDILLANEFVENNLELLGISAVEDVLQQKCEETVSKLKKAGITICVLTGDKDRTAQSVARACGILNTECTPLNSNLNSVSHVGQPVSVDGKTLETILLDFELKKKFTQILETSSTTICSRLSPLQKAEIVRLVKSRHVCLAIGDGANDVPMLYESQIGIGVHSNQSASPALRCADFTIPKFRHLQHLLLHSGRINKKRTETFIGYLHYKNTALALISYFYNILPPYSGLAGTPEFYNLIFNSILTSWPSLFAFLFDSDFEPRESREQPNLYLKDKNNSTMHVKQFFRYYVLTGVYQSVCSCYLTYFSVAHQTTSLGLHYGYYSVAMLSFTIIFVVVNCQLFIYSSRWLIITLVAALVSVSIFVVICVVGSLPQVARIGFAGIENMEGISDLKLWNPRYYHENFTIFPYATIGISLISLLPYLMFHALN